MIQDARLRVKQSAEFHRPNRAKKKRSTAESIREKKELPETNIAVGPSAPPMIPTEEARAVAVRRRRRKRRMDNVRFMGVISC